VILAVAPVAGYAFGYDNAAERAAVPRHAARTWLRPAYIVDGTGSGAPGVRLFGRF